MDAGAAPEPRRPLAPLEGRGPPEGGFLLLASSWAIIL
jgi:hypothetical protein